MSFVAGTQSFSGRDHTERLVAEVVADSDVAPDEAASDAEMDGIEARMKILDGQVNDAFTALSTPPGDAMKASVDEARAAYAEFQKVNAEVLRLSRRNSNVRSLAISLGQKRKVTAECQDRLTAVQEAVRSDGPGPTR